MSCDTSSGEKKTLHMCSLNFLFVLKLEITFMLLKIKIFGICRCRNLIQSNPIGRSSRLRKEKTMQFTVYSLEMFWM